MTQQLTEDNNNLLKKLIQFILAKEEFSVALAEHQNINAEHYKTTGTVLPPPESLIQLHRKIAESKMAMAEAANLLEEYTG